MTMKQLAKLANVSVSTVSKAFNGAEDISHETREHVFAVARQYDCYEKFYKGKYYKKTIAVICPEISSSYYTRFVDALQKMIEQAGYISVVAAHNFEERKQLDLIDYFASYQKVDGIIIFGLDTVLKKQYDTPIIALLSCADPKIDFVGVNSMLAMKEAVKTLVEYGHRHIAFLGEPLAVVKTKHYISAMKASGKGFPCVILSNSRFEQAGEDGVKRLIAEGKKFTALICAYDNIAFGAIKQLKREGLRVPEDVSVIGMDNISVGRYTGIELSTIGTQPEEVCMIAWNLLHKKIKNPYYVSKQNIIINEDLILRESVAKNTRTL